MVCYDGSVEEEVSQLLVDILKQERAILSETLRQNKILLEAVEYYAGVLNWSSDSGYGNDTIDSEDMELIEIVIESHDCSDYYGGKRAREAIKAVRSE